jgi:hypothetical protein
MYRVHWIDPDWETKWGLGFATWRTRETTYVGHGGSCPGYRSQLSLDPKARIAVVFMSNASGVNASRFTDRVQQIVAPAVAAAIDSSSQEEPTDPALERYTGTYDLSPWWGEEEVFLWKGKLALLGLPTTDPVGEIVQLERVGEHRFRRIRDDGEPGEEIRVDVAEDGSVLRLWQHSNFSPKVR